MRCFACGTDAELRAGERVGHRESCARCRADLHVCRNCRHHDPSLANECREPNAEPVRDRERANGCEWFAPAERAAAGAAERARDARAALDALFKKS